MQAKLTGYFCPYCFKEHGEPDAVCCGEQHVEMMTIEYLTDEQRALAEAIDLLQSMGVSP